MSPRSAQSFFGGIQSGYQARSNQAAAQQAAQEKLSKHMRNVKNDKTSLQNQIGDDARSLMTEFSAATPDTMEIIQDKMWSLVQTTEDKSMLPQQMLDGSYGLPVYEGVAEAMVSGVDSEGFEKQGPGIVAKQEGAAVQGPGELGSPLGAAKKTSNAYQKLKSARSKKVDAIARGKGTPTHVLAGYGSKTAMRRGEAKQTGHFSMLGILTNGGKTDPSLMLTDDRAWANAKDQFYVWAEGRGMPGTEAKAVVDRFEKERTQISEGKESESTHVTDVLKDTDKWLGEIFEVDAGVGGIASKLQGQDKAAYLGAMDRIQKMLMRDPTKSFLELRWSVMGLLVARGAVEPGFDFKLAQMDPDLADIGNTGEVKPDYAVEAEKYIPGSRYDSDAHSLSYIHPLTGKLDYIIGDKLIARIARQNKIHHNQWLNREEEREAQAKKAEMTQAARVEAFFKGEKKEDATRRDEGRQGDVSRLRDTEIIGGIRSGIGAVGEVGSDIGEIGGYLLDDAGNIIERGIEGVKRGGTKAKNVAESIFGGL